MAAAAPSTQAWWRRPAIWLLVIFAAGIPLWLPAVPPLTDFPGHMGRYAVQLDGGQSADLAEFYHFQWQWLGNLGVDLIVQAIGPFLGVEAASKLSAIAIAMLTTAGLLAVAQEVHGRLPPTVFFALPLAWSYPFLWGFVNFALSMALAFLAFAVWLRLGRLGRTRLRCGLFAILSLVLWTAHIYGWAALCILAASAELVRAGLVSGQGWRAFWPACLRCLCLTPPMILMVLNFRGGGAGGQPLARLWFNLDMKARWVESILRDRWEVFDKASLLLLGLVLLAALVHWARDRRLPSGAPLILAAALFAALFVILPHALLGSAYADMRLAPYALATALLAIGPSMPCAAGVAALAMLFFGIRTAGTTVSMIAYDRAYQTELEAVTHLPRGARVAALVGKPCAPGWRVHRMDHLPSLALVRRHAFVNDQWQAAGAQLISVRYAAAGAFRADPSQFVVEPRCERRERKAFAKAIAEIPRTAFDYVWVIQQPAAQADLTGLVPVWRTGRSALYRIVRTQ